MVRHSLPRMSRQATAASLDQRSRDANGSLVLALRHRHVREVRGQIVEARELDRLRLLVVSDLIGEPDLADALAAGAEADVDHGELVLLRADPLLARLAEAEMFVGGDHHLTPGRGLDVTRVEPRLRARLAGARAGGLDAGTVDHADRGSRRLQRVEQLLG